MSSKHTRDVDVVGCACWQGAELPGETRFSACWQCTVSLDVLYEKVKGCQKRLSDDVTMSTIYVSHSRGFRIRKTLEHQTTFPQPLMNRLEMNCEMSRGDCFWFVK